MTDVTEHHLFKTSMRYDYSIWNLETGDWKAAWIDQMPDGRESDSFTVYNVRAGVVEQQAWFSGAIAGDLDELIALLTALRAKRDVVRRARGEGVLLT